MSQWRLNRWGLFILGTVVFLMLLIVILPDVDLPDTAFHNGNAPILVHARVTSAPAITVVAAFCLAVAALAFRHLPQQRPSAAHHTANFLPIFLRSIRR